MWSSAFIWACAIVTEPALAAESNVWFGVKAGPQFFQDKDVRDLDAVATHFSNPSDNRVIDFNSKAWEFVLGLQVGLNLSEKASVYLAYERQPYILEAPSPPVPPVGTLPTDTVRLAASANFWGAGFDFQLFSGYSQSVRLGVAGGILKMKGEDQDIQSLTNFTMEGDGIFVDTYLFLDHEFTDEIAITPFAAYRSARTSDAVARDATSPPEAERRDFEVDYSGFILGVGLRLRPF
jgi:hypothetical protein